MQTVRHKHTAHFCLAEKRQFKGNVKHCEMHPEMLAPTRHIWRCPWKLIALSHVQGNATSATIFIKLSSIIPSFTTSPSIRPSTSLVCPVLSCHVQRLRQHKHSALVATICEAGVDRPAIIKRPTFTLLWYSPSTTSIDNRRSMKGIAYPSNAYHVFKALPTMSHQSPSSGDYDWETSRSKNLPRTLAISRPWLTGVVLCSRTD